MIIDATNKNCKGIIAALEKAMEEMNSGESVEAIVSGVPNKVDVYAWAARKSHKIQTETKDGPVFRITVVK